MADSSKTSANGADLSAASGKPRKKGFSSAPAKSGGEENLLQGQPSLIKFPADLSVKAMGLNTPDFQDLITHIVGPLIAPATPHKVVTQASSGDKYLSVRVHFTALNQAQLEKIYTALRAEPRVLFTL